MVATTLGSLRVHAQPDEVPQVRRHALAQPGEPLGGVGGLPPPSFASQRGMVKWLSVTTGESPSSWHRTHWRR